MPFRTFAPGKPMFPVPLATEKVAAREVKPGDTLIDYNTHRVPAYRVVSKSAMSPHSVTSVVGEVTTKHDMWSITFDRARDVAGPGESYMGTFSAAGLTASPDHEWERVTELPAGMYMTQAGRFKDLDWVDGISRDKHHVFWQKANQIDSKDNILVRFARDDDFMRLPRLGQDIYLVRPHRDYR